MNVTGKLTTSRSSMGGRQITRIRHFPHSSDRAVTVSCDFGHSCRRSSFRRRVSSAATLKIEGSATVRAEGTAHLDVARLSCPTQTKSAQLPPSHPRSAHTRCDNARNRPPYRDKPSPRKQHALRSTQARNKSKRSPQLRQPLPVFESLPRVTRQ